MAKKSGKVDERRYSRLVVDGAKQTPSRAMLRAVGFQDADFSKPQIGVASTWASLTPCNVHINDLATEAMAGADGAGGKGVLFNTITVSDGISMGSPGMRYSLVSREVIADSIETRRCTIWSTPISMLKIAIRCPNRAIFNAADSMNEVLWLTIPFAIKA